MRNYEVAYIADPDLDETGLTALEDKVKSWIEGAGGSIVKVDHWGRRRLAYPINKRRDGVYVFVYAEMAPSAVISIESNMRLNEQIVRFMVTNENPA
jgi:small subunit ribosomal protein S6